MTARSTIMLLDILVMAIVTIGAIAVFLLVRSFKASQPQTPRELTSPSPAALSGDVALAARHVEWGDTLARLETILAQWWRVDRRRPATHPPVWRIEPAPPATCRLEVDPGAIALPVDGVLVSAVADGCARLILNERAESEHLTLEPLITSCLMTTPAAGRLDTTAISEAFCEPHTAPITKVLSDLQLSAFTGRPLRIHGVAWFAHESLATAIRDFDKGPQAQTIKIHDQGDSDISMRLAVGEPLKFTAVESLAFLRQ